MGRNSAKGKQRQAPIPHFDGEPTLAEYVNAKENEKIDIAGQGIEGGADQVDAKKEVNNSLQLQPRTPYVWKDDFPEEPIDPEDIIKSEERKDVVYEVKPYFTHSVLQATCFLYITWSLVYFIYRGGWTLNNASWATYVYSVLFLVVEFLSFLASAIHYSNFSNICTNVLLQKLPEILERQKKDYPPIASFICCYKEPHHIVSRTIGYVIFSFYSYFSLYSLITTVLFSPL